MKMALQKADNCESAQNDTLADQIKIGLDWSSMSFCA
jgi:hypothetical protein